MPIDLPKQYDPQAAQEKWYSFWEREGFFNADPPAVPSEDPHSTPAARKTGDAAHVAKPPHTIMIPLPNVTGALHMGCLLYTSPSPRD